MFMKLITQLTINLKDIIRCIHFSERISTHRTHTHTPFCIVLPGEIILVVIGKSFCRPKHREGISCSLMPIFGGIVLCQLQRHIGFSSPRRTRIAQRTCSIQGILTNITHNGSLYFSTSNRHIFQSLWIADRSV